MAPPGRVLIAHADPLARAYVRRLAESELRLVNTVEADSFDTLLAQLREESGIVLVIVDLDLPGMSWDAGLRYLGMEHYGVPVAVLSDSLSQDKVESLLSINRTTALIPKQLPEASLIEILGRMLAGIDDFADLARALWDHRTEAQLTGRQHEVLRLLSEGRSNREISKILGIAEGTVKVHVNAAFRVLGVRNRVSATVAFREHFSDGLGSTR
jgi:DNA-binding NarL/FixJ family response regulator